ncbi:hypothetical protein MNBD_ALPHA06-459 [hydrothermal vent metagenome]|uniref:Lipoprotein n=1 Tax=hydrothermal vent metagenome TaxID=652676 RepID=A0A3B0R511_9ZZZZ
MKNLILPVLLLCFPALVSCAGFSPVYAENSAARKMFPQISMPSIAGKNGFLLSQEMQDRGGIHIGESAKYVLRINLTPSRVGFAVRADSVSRRFEIQMDAYWVLYDERGTVLTSMDARSSTAFDSPSNPYTAQVAEQDAEARAVAVLADAILDQLGFYFAKQADNK